MPDPTPPPYLPAVLDLAAGASPGRVTDVFVLHDDGCPILSGVGACACTPTVTRGFTLWHRKSRRHAWEAIATRATERECYDAIAKCGRKGGDFLVLAAEKQP